LAIRALPAGCGARANTPFLCELKRKRPSIVFIMYGTNDLERSADTATFQRNLTTMVHQSLAAGVIPVLSTIPPRTDSFSSRVDNYNQAIISVAQHNQVPLWNYWRVFQRVDLVDNGLDPDGIHPNVYQQDQGADFGQIALQYGYNQRNLTAIQILDLIRNVVILDGPPT
jgi:lysophospholipase L1-like esterase